MAKPKQTIEEKADRYLAEGRVSVEIVDPAASEATVRVKGSESYEVKYVGVWVCDCPARVDRCAHIAAAEKVVHLASGKKVHLGGRDVEIDFLLGI